MANLQEALLRHSRHYLEINLSAGSLFSNREVVQGLRLFDKEQENIRKGRDWATQNINLGREIAINAMLFLIQGDILKLRTAPEELISLMEKAVGISRLSSTPYFTTVFLNSLGVAYRRVGMIQKAITCFHEALKTLQDEREDDPTGKVILYQNLIGVYQEIKDFKSAEEYMEKQLLCINNIPDGEVKLSFQAQHDRNYLIQRGDFSIIKSLLKELDRVREIGDKYQEIIVSGQIGYYYQKEGKDQLALNIIRQSLVLAEEINDKQGQVVALINLFAVCEKANEEDAIEYLKRAQDLESQLGNKRLQNIIQLEIEKHAIESGQPELALQILTDEIRNSIQLNDIEAYFIGIKTLANAHIAKGDFESPIMIYDNALAVLHEAKFKYIEILILQELGDLYSLRKEWHHAETRYKDAIKLSKSTLNLETIALSLYKTGSYFQSRSRYKLAMQYFHESLQKYELAYLAKGQLMVIRALGETYRLQGKRNLACSCYEKALNLSREFSYLEEEICTLFAYGDIFFEMKEFSSAAKAFAQVVQLAGTKGDQVNEAAAQSKLGNVYFGEKQYRKALENYVTAMHIFRKIKDHKNLCHTLWNISLILESMNEFEKALTFAEASILIGQKNNLSLTDGNIQRLEQLRGIFKR